MIDAENGLSVRTQCEFVQVPRSGYYYQPKQQCGEDGELMNEIYEIWFSRTRLRIPPYHTPTA